MYTSLTYSVLMYTIIETPIFTKLADDLLSTEELQEFCVYIANNPEAGDVIPRSGSCRKVRWARKGMGKRGGTRVIYYNKLDDGVIYLLVIYAKAVQENIPAHLLKEIKEALDNE